MARNRFTLEGDARGAVKAVQDLNKALQGSEKGFEQAAKKGDMLSKAAAKIVRDNEGPQERYNRKIAELSELVNKGRLAKDQAAIAARRYRDQLERVTRAGKDAFGSSAVTQIRNYALQFTALSRGVGVVADALRQIQQENERLAQGRKAARSGYGALAQLAATRENPQAAKRALDAEAETAYASGAFADENAAALAVFSYHSASLNRRDRRFATELQRTGVMSDVGGAATAYNAMRTALGEKEVGGFEEFMSKALRASAAAPAQATEIPIAAGSAAGSAQSLGLTRPDEFLMAATAIAASKTGNAGQGGTQIAAFLKSVEKAGLDTKGRSGVELVEMIAAMPESEQGFGGVLGDRAEAIAGFRTLRDNIDQLRELESGVDASQREGLARTSLDLAMQSMSQRAAVGRAAAEARRDLGLRNSANLQNLYEAAWAERERTFVEDSWASESLMRVALETQRKGADFLNWVSGDALQRTAIESMVEDGSIRDQELLRDIKDYLQQGVTTRPE